MSQEERFNERERSYSAWHRRHSTRRFVGIEKAQTLALIDLDASLYVEYDDGSKEPLALIETARDVGQDFKVASVTKKLAKRTRPVVAAYVLLYRLSTSRNPADRKWFDIESFRYRRIWPEPETAWIAVTPKQWCEQLVQLRDWSARKLDKALPQASAPSIYQPPPAKPDVFDDEEPTQDFGF